MTFAALARVLLFIAHVPSHEHHALVRLFDERPALIVEVLRALGVVPAHGEVATTELASDLSTLQPAERRVDAAFAIEGGGVKLVGLVEVQRSIDSEKLFTWPAYVADLRARRRCEAVLVVVATTKRVAKWARRPIPLGPGNRWSCLVLGPGDLRAPSEEEARACPELAVLAAVLRRDASDQAEVAQRAFEACRALPSNLSLTYADLVWAALGRHAKTILETRMRTHPEDFQSDIAKNLLAKGRREGRQEGLAQALRIMLERRFGPLGAEHDAKLNSASAEMLARYTERVLTADGLEAALADDEPTSRG